MPRKTTVIDGVTYEELGPYCEFCGHHMGEFYNSHAKGEQETFLNPDNYDSFGDNKCRGCGMEYSYDEGHFPILTDEEKKMILEHRRKSSVSAKL